MQSRRARKSYEQWAELVAEYDNSGFTMEAFCLHKNLAMSTFQRWRNTIHRTNFVKHGDVASAFTQVTPIPTETPVPPSAITLQIGRSITVTIQTTEST